MALSRTSRRLAALLLTVAAPIAAQAQTEAPAETLPARRPYVRLASGVGLLTNLTPIGDGEQYTVAVGVGGALEIGVEATRLAAGVEVSAMRSRHGGPQDLIGSFPSSDWADAVQASAVGIVRARNAWGPVDFMVGTGAGLGYASTVVQSAPDRVMLGADGRVVSPVDTRRESGVVPLFHLDAAIGHRIGRTFVGLDYSSEHVLFGQSAVRTGTARFGLALHQTL